MLSVVPVSQISLAGLTVGQNSGACEKPGRNGCSARAFAIFNMHSNYVDAKAGADVMADAISQAEQRQARTMHGSGLGPT